MSIDILKPELKKHGTPRQCEYLDAVLKYGSATKAAKRLGVNRRTVDRSISAIKRAAIEAGDVTALHDGPRVLVLDIETAPIMAHIWQMFNEVRNIDQVLADWYMLSWSAKWLHDPAIITRSLRSYKGYTPGSENDKALVQELHSMLCEAEYVVAHNGDRFDIKKFNTRFLVNKIPPPTPYRSIDTLKMAKRTFGFTSNKLDFLSRILLNERKLEHDGLPLWQAVLRGDAQAWETMEKYNEKDVILLEKIYLKLRGWDHLHPNMNLTTSQDNMSCTVCGSSNVQPTGDVVAAGQTGLYLGYVCKECDHQMRGRTNLRTISQKHAGLVNAR